MRLSIAEAIWWGSKQGHCTGGLATLLEKKSRRMELALYCLSHATMSFALCLVEWGLVRERHVPARLDVLMFSAAAAAIMHCYSDGHGRHRDVFRSKYLNYLDFVFGSEGAARNPGMAPPPGALPASSAPAKQAQHSPAHALSFTGNAPAAHGCTREVQKGCPK